MDRFFEITFHRGENRGDHGSEKKRATVAVTIAIVRKSSWYFD
jgi:hypothetical protein